MVHTILLQRKVQPRPQATRLLWFVIWVASEELYFQIHWESMNGLCLQPSLCKPGSDHLRRWSDSRPCPRCGLSTCFGMRTSPHMQQRSVGFSRSREQEQPWDCPRTKTGLQHLTLEASSFSCQEFWDFKSVLKAEREDQRESPVQPQWEVSDFWGQIFLRLYFISIT